MTLTFDKLKDVMDEVKRQGFEIQVPEVEIDKIIIRKIGVSEYTIKSVKKGLIRAELIKRNPNGLFDIVEGG
jgi:hypothetical protein